MAITWGIPILSEDGSKYGLIIPAIVYTTATTNEQITVSDSTTFNTYLLSTGTDLRQYISPPLTDDATSDTDVYYSLINSDSNYYLNFNVTHTEGKTSYTLKLRICDSDKNVLTLITSISLTCSDSETYNYLYVNQSAQLAIYPSVDKDSTSDITHLGMCRLKSYTEDMYTQILSNMYSLSGWFGTTFDDLFGYVVKVPTYPSGGVDPEDNWGGDENNFDTTSDDIEMPSVVASAINNGYVQTYLITASQMAELMSEVLDFTNTTVTDFWSNVSKVFGDPISAIVSLKHFCVPTDDIPTWGATNVKLLNFTSEVTCPVVNTQYSIIDVGTIDIDEFFGGFLDYPPYTRCTIYLPFIGEKELNVQEVMGASLHLYYMVDYLTGNCVAHLIVSKTAGETDLNSDLYQWQGNLATDIPISGNNDAQTLGNIISSAVSGLSSLAMGSINGGISAIGNVLTSAGGNKVLAGSIGGGFSLMGVRVPYIKIENPIQTIPENFQDLRGLAGNINHTIGDLSGFLRCREVDINNITATDDEKAELYALLTGGIFI